MKLEINNKLIQRNKTIGNVTSIAGIAILAGGLILNINPTPTKTLISFGALIVGFVISQVSTYFITRFSRSPRFDEIIANNLDKLNNDYTFHVYSGPVPMVLVGPAGLWVPIPITASGEIYFDKKWKQKGGSFLLKLFGQENIGRPSLDIESNEREINKNLSRHFSEGEMPLVSSILVLLHPKGTIGDVQNAPTPIVEANALRRMIRKIDRKVDNGLTPEMIDQINEIFRQ